MSLSYFFFSDLIADATIERAASSSTCLWFPALSNSRNLDFQSPFKEWSYTFDEETMPLNTIESIGVATNNSYGITSVSTIDVVKNLVKSTYYNE